MNEEMLAEYELAIGLDDHGASVIRLLERGLDPNSRYSHGANLLYLATLVGKERVVEDLIARGADVNQAAGSQLEFDIPLHIAARMGWSSIVRQLVSAGAHLSTRNSVRATPLHEAASQGFPDIVEFLLVQGAELSPENAIKRGTPLHVAVASGALKDAPFIRKQLADELQADGVTIPTQPASDHERVISILLRRGIGRKEFNKATKIANMYNSQEILNVLNFHGHN